MKTRKAIVAGVLVVLGVPVLLAAIAVASFYAAFHFPNRSSATPHALSSGGARREYLLYVPPSYDRATAAPLVISLHPAMSWPAAELAISGWNRLADEHGFIVAYPAGTGGGPKAWFMEGRRTPSRMPDVRFISDLIDTLEAAYRIDPARIYADGMSNGGGMAFALSCTLSRRIAAFGLVSAAQSLPWSWCADSTPVPMIAFHGTGDPIVPFRGADPGWLNPEPFPNVPLWVAHWARRDRCAPRAERTRPAQGIQRTEYTRCAHGASVVLYAIGGGGHQWPGGRPLPRFIVGPYSSAIDATSEMWAFFRQHPLAAQALASTAAPGGTSR